MHAGPNTEAERLIWLTGCMLVHPRPFVEAFWAFQFPQAMIDAGTPPMTLEMKQRILGGNLARVLGIPKAQQARLIAMWSEASMSKEYATKLADARVRRVIPIAQHAVTA